MGSIDIKCSNCEYIFQSYKKNQDGTYKILSCPMCKSKDTYRQYKNVSIKVNKGKLGNASNGYSNVSKV